LGQKAARYAPQARALTEEMVNRFNPDAAGDWTISIGLQVTAEAGVPEVRYALSINGGTADMREGDLPANADLVIRVPAGTWAAILLGKRRIETAMLQGKLKLDGQAEQGLKLRKVFGI
jgi:putative sterol carrier protein